MAKRKIKETHLMNLISGVRKSKNITQLELTQHMGNVTPQHLSNIERGHSPFPMIHLRKVARFLEIPKETVKAAMVRDYLNKLEKFI